MQVKVCGITDIEQIRRLAELGVDYAGMIFYEGSKRFVANKMDPALVKGLAIKKVGVFVNANASSIREAIDLYGLDAIQLHGDETAADIKQYATGVVVIKAFKIKGRPDVDEMVNDYKDVCDFYLFDTSPALENQHGGSGEQFDWTILEGAKINKPFFLSGGIGPSDVESVKKFTHPFFQVVDINSRFEVLPGLKDMNLVSGFVDAMRD